VVARSQAAEPKARTDALSVRAWFGIGQIGEGIAGTALGSILLFYFSQVLGLDPRMAGLALLISTITDGVADVIVGAWSDTTRHRWGRRHPFMYASVIPFAASFAFLFLAPHGASQTLLFYWLLFGSLVCRNVMTFFVIPHYALGADMSSDHHQRTVIVAFRAAGNYIGRAAVFLAGVIFFAPSAGFPTGQMDPARYGPYGLTLAATIFLLTLGSTLGTHATIPELPRAREGEKFHIGLAFAELYRAAKHWPLQVFLIGFFIWVVAQVVFGTLQIHLGTYFWKLESRQVFLLPLMGAIAQLVATPVWVPFARRFGKKAAFIASVGAFCVVESALVGGKILGFVAPGEAGYTAYVFGGHFISAMLGAAPTVVAGSMLADIADYIELKTGVRREGVLFGAIGAAVKISGGAGAQFAGFLVYAAGLHGKVDPRTIGPEVGDHLALITIAMLFGFGIAAAAFYLCYPLSKARHLEVQAGLQARRSAEGLQSPAEINKAARSAPIGLPPGAEATSS
jgi:glycoside/pentoside/hexuronide:cation symporter, GPH family